MLVTTKDRQRHAKNSKCKNNMFLIYSKCPEVDSFDRMWLDVMRVCHTNHVVPLLNLIFLGIGTPLLMISLFRFG